MAKRPGRGLIDRMDVWNEKLGYENENLRLQTIWEKRPGGRGGEKTLDFFFIFSPWGAGNPFASFYFADTYLKPKI